jgi:TPR repeat protein
MFDFWTARANSSASVATPTAKPCEPGNPPKVEAQEAFLNGELLWKAKTDDRSAVCWYRVAALQGHATAQARLGKAYILGLGVPKDYSQAFEWDKKSAEQGDWDGEMQMAFAYEQGAGVAYDFKRAQEWHAKANAHQPKEITALANQLNRQIGQASAQALIGAGRCILAQR